MQESFSIGLLLGIFFKRWKFLILGSLAIAVLAVVVSLLLPKKYLAGVTILPQQESASSPLAAILGQSGLPFASSLLGQGGSAEIHKEILLSFTVGRRVVEALDLYEPFDLVEERETDPLGVEQSAVALLTGSLQLEILPPSQMLRLLVLAREPALARDIAARYIEELDRFNREQLQESGRRKRVFLERRLEQVQVDRATARQAIQDFSAQHGVVYLPAELEGELALVAELERRLVFKELKRAELAMDASGQSPALRRIDAEIEVLQAKLRELEEGGSESGPRFLALETLPALSLEYYRLQRELRIQQEVSDLLLQQVEQARLQEASDIPTLQILDHPQLPTMPVWPPKKLIVVGATLIGFLCLCLIVLVVDFYRRVRENRDENFAAWQWLPGLARRSKT